MYTQKTKIYIKRHRCHNNIVPHCPLSSICIPLTTPYFFCRTNTPHTQTTPYMISQSLYVCYSNFQYCYPFVILFQLIQIVLFAYTVYVCAFCVYMVFFRACVCSG